MRGRGGSGIPALPEPSGTGGGELCPAQGPARVGHGTTAVCHRLPERGQHGSLKVHPGGSGHVKITSQEHTGDFPETWLLPEMEGWN